MDFLTAKNVCYSYGAGQFSLKNINFGLRQGETLAMIGPNGAGKSTLMRILSGLLKGYAGEVSISGNDIKKMDGAALARLISYIPQSSEHAFNFTVEEIVAMGRRPYINPGGSLKPGDIEAVKSAIEGIGIYGKRSAKYSTLSGGEKRMVLIARAIAQDTPAVFMDEPMTFLDIQHQSMLMEAIVGLNRSGKSVLLISHGINLASEYASRVAIMKDGLIVTSGTAKECINMENIRAIYGFDNFDIADNPRTGRPNIFIAPENRDVTKNSMAI
jgi:iron complex transport system ATP-binding protein